MLTLVTAVGLCAALGLGAHPSGAASARSETVVRLAGATAKPATVPVSERVPPVAVPAEPTTAPAADPTRATPAPASLVTTTAPPAPTTVAPVPDPCATALAYLAAHAAPGFAHFCRPGSLQTALGASAGYTCVPGPAFSCPDGVAEIIIADPSCPASYENEASNSYWNFSQAGVIAPGTVQDGRTWDPFGTCPAS